MTSRSHGRFRPRLWHLAILALFFALFLGSPLAPDGRALGARALLNLPLFLLVASPWLFGAVILVFDRKHQVKLWVAPLLLSLLAPVLVAFDNWPIVLHWPPTQNLTLLISSLLINLVLVWRFTFSARSLCPRCCPECDNWSMIPLQSFAGSTARTKNTLWCASCGALYWRTNEGEWKKERRQIWLDLPPRKATPKAGKDGRPFDTDSRAIAPVVRTRGRSKSVVLDRGNQGGPDLENQPAHSMREDKLNLPEAPHRRKQGEGPFADHG